MRNVDMELSWKLVLYVVGQMDIPLAFLVLLILKLCDPCHLGGSMIAHDVGNDF